MISFEIEKEIAVLSERTKDGFQKELNLVSWNGRKAKYDIRSWDEHHEKMQKGITLSEEEIKNLKEALNNKIE